MQLVAIAYADVSTAILAMEELEGCERDLVIRRDEMAAIVRDEEAVFTTVSNAVITSEQPTWAMFWGTLFATLFYVPFLGMTFGSDLAPIIDEVRRSGPDPMFEDRIREAVAPGTSALFVLVEKVEPDTVVEALEGYGGTVLQAEISPEAEEMLQRTLAGRRDVA
jgi:uncharacterized membrane protein